jgi:hypothetical protein
MLTGSWLPSRSAAFGSFLNVIIAERATVRNEAVIFVLATAPPQQGQAGRVSSSVRQKATNAVSR